MEEYLSASARRALDAAARWARHLAAAEINTRHLLLGIAEQEESRGALLLAEFGLTRDTLPDMLSLSDRPNLTEDGQPPSIPLSQPVRQVLSRARGWSVERTADNPAGTDILLLELLHVPDFQQYLVAQGLIVPAIEQRLLQELGAEADGRPLTAEFSRLEIGDPSDLVDTYRILDASCNRAREGLRVLEDFARFARDDRYLAAELKGLRHQLAASLQCLPHYALLASRDTQHDVGTDLSTQAEWLRNRLADVLVANFKRVQEALRSLEEFGKLESRPFAESMERIRYQLYTLERAMLLGTHSETRLAGVVLYLLVSSDVCVASLEWTVTEALAGGAQVIQLREKSMPDRELGLLACRLCQLTRNAGALFIMNDRPDIARMADADGVHLGQEDLGVKDARRIVGPQAVVGVSTHSIEQARQAVLDGANYIGTGPTFPSATKSFDAFPGLGLIRQVHEELRLPAFAIGGISMARMDDVLAAGARRVAVSAAICQAEDPRIAAAELRRRLEACF